MISWKSPFSLLEIKPSVAVALSTYMDLIDRKMGFLYEIMSLYISYKNMLGTLDQA